MSTESGVRIRFSTPLDAPRLLELERQFFPAVAGQRHDGFVFDQGDLTRFTLTADTAAPERMLTVVAEAGSEIVGFAMATPSAFPGTGQIDPTNMLLQYIAVIPSRRREGVASALLAEIEKRSLRARQNVIIAHVPPAQEAFYRANGWDVFAEGRGYAWLPFNSVIRADIADPAIGFPLMASKVLRPRAVRATFDFPVVHGRPMLDAFNELILMIRAGRVDALDLDEETRSVLEATQGMPGVVAR